MIRTEPNYVLEITALRIELRRLRTLCAWAAHTLIPGADADPGCTCSRCEVVRALRAECDPPSCFTPIDGNATHISGAAEQRAGQPPSAGATEEEK